ncbi:unnamed protein product [Oikopleura dioica]|uniref:Uncharacterized protein n=1 Tax=Oikopleura dioica TaxID=34765 RepID=E4YT56_OIKDI|nr:unnamed protein product [Oikopleura dioica]
MPKGRKTGNNASKLTKFIRTTLIENKNAPPISDDRQQIKEKPTVKDEPEDPGNENIMEKSFTSQARRLMSMARELLNENTSPTSKVSEVSESAYKTTRKMREATKTMSDLNPESSIVDHPPTLLKIDADAELGINDTEMLVESTVPIDQLNQRTACSFTPQDSPLRRARPAKRNGIKAVRIEVQSDSVELISPAKDNQSRKKQRADEKSKNIPKKKKKTVTKGFINDPSILPATKRLKRDKSKKVKDDYDDPEREWEVQHVGGLCLEWGKRRRKIKNGRTVTEWFIKPDSEHRIWIMWKDPFRDNGAIWSAEVQENLVGVDRELIERALRRKKCYPMPNPSDGLEDWEDRKIEAVLLGFTQWKAPPSLVKNGDKEVRFIPIER